MILPDHQIIKRCKHDGLVSPFIPANVQPASIDVTLGNEFMWYLPRNAPIDTRDVNDHGMANAVISDGYSMIIPAGKFFLAATRERVKIPDSLVARIEGKSSLGRVGLMVHVTAGFIDPGFEGNVTLEIYNLLDRPIMLYPGMSIAQISFHTLDGRVDTPYQGRYQGAEGVQASRYGYPFVQNHIPAPPADAKWQGNA